MNSPSQINPVHTLTPFQVASFIHAPPPSTKTQYTFLLSPHTRHMFAHLIPPSFGHPTNIWSALQIIKSLIKKCSSATLLLPPFVRQYVTRRSALSGSMSHVMSVRAMVQAVSRRPLSAKVQVRFQVSPCKICGRQSGTGQGFLPTFRFSPVSTIPPLLHIHSFIHSFIRLPLIT